MTEADKKKHNELITVLNDIAQSLRIMSGRSEMVKTKKKESYVDFYFSQTVDDK